jgi:phosphate-selective porin OprO/OprP
MEPSSVLQALAPGTSAGAQIGRTIFNQRATWRLGAFTEGVGTEYGDASRDYGRAIGRVTWLAIDNKKADENDWDRYLHLGLSANLLYSSTSTIRYRSRPESHLAPYVIDTGEISARGALTLGAEAAWVNGPFSVQGEYLHSIVQKSEDEYLNFDGFYGSVSWFLTGETRRYDRTDGDFVRVIPRHNFDWGRGGWGAVEVAGRYSFVNLNSGDVSGGRLGIMMAGVNWYLHPHIRWKLDYGFGRVTEHSPRGNINIFQTRMEVDF